ncbi:uncharacterized protein LOC143020532 [Oratosquilla oratoria]|uniref:uncharacterized protein LOC143020532 n=1 Tax=Oratosquilla oratoria TaxID=337810 RepID=UPI003F765AC8
MEKATKYQLKQYLKLKSQSCSGNKAELISKIQEFVTAEELDADEVVHEILAFNRTPVEEEIDGTVKSKDSVSQAGESDLGSQLENDSRDCRSTNQSNNDDQQTNRDIITTLMTKTTMPVHVITKFSGQLDKYFEFIKDFDMLIDSKHVSDNEKLQYLKQYTEGKPHKIVRTCLHLDPKEGYQKARSELKKRYGNKERIALMHIDKVLAWPEIKEENVETLDDFIVELDSCISAMSGIHYGISELQNLRTLRQLVEKLPRYLQDRWRRIADELAESGKLVDIKELVRFLEKEVRILNNPIFGRSIEGGFRDEKVEANTWNSNRKMNYKKELRWLTYEEKLNKAYSLELCFKCLRKGHKASQCRVIRTCEQCGGSHLTTMHRTNKNFRVEGSKEVTANPVVTNEVDDSRVQVLSSQLKDSVGDTTAIPVQVELNDHSIRKNDIEKWKHLMKLEFDHSKGEIEIMIGSNVLEASEPWEVVHAEKVGEPYAVRTRLGWVLCGRIIDNNQEVAVNNIKVDGNYLERKLIESYNREFVDSSLNSVEPSMEDRRWLHLLSLSVGK